MKRMVCLLLLGLLSLQLTEAQGWIREKKALVVQNKLLQVELAQLRKRLAVYEAQQSCSPQFSCSSCQKLQSKLAREKQCYQKSVRENQKLQQKLEHITINYRQLEGNLQQSCQKIATLEKQNAALQASYLQVVDDKQQLQQQVQALQTELASVQVSKKHRFNIEFVGFNEAQLSLICAALNNLDENKSRMQIIENRVDTVGGKLLVTLHWSRKEGPRKVFQALKKTLQRLGIAVKLQDVNANSLLIVSTTSGWHFD